MKIFKEKKIWFFFIIALVLVLLTGTVFMLVLSRHNKVLEEQQQQALQELYDNEGRYDPQSIILSNTSKSRAEEMAKAFGAKLRITKDGRFATLTLPEGVSVFDIYGNEENRKYMEFMSLDYQARISDLKMSDETVDPVSNERLPTRPQYSVSDTDYNYQTYLNYLNMSTIWNKTQGSGITVAIIDTGIDTDHPEFAGRISEFSYNASEDKIVKDWCLEDGTYDWSLIEDLQGHGTAVAGVIAASMDGNGVVGIAPQVNIIVIKAECDENGTFKRTSDLVFGLYYAIERDVAVVNMSFGSDANPYAEAIRLAIDSDVICVAAAGNQATANLTYPAADENVFGVGALAENSWELALYSNYGENVDFVAPGTVYTTKMGGGYGGMNGTSFASPITAGVLALYLSQNMYQDFKTIEELICASCYDLGENGPDWYYGYGALDVRAMILEERGTVTFNMMTDEVEDIKQLFIRDHTLQNIPEPERLYSVFDGWYYDPQCTDEYVWYQDAFHGDLTLYASWVNEEDGVPYTYGELEDGTIEIRSYTGHRKYITIPDYIDGKEVSSIGEFAFKNQTRIREVTLPKYLKRIRASAFEGCTNLVRIEIPDTVTEIGEKAFYDNVRLSAVVFGENSQLSTIGRFAFSGCSKMRTFTVPAAVTTLDATAFYRNTSMVAVDIQKGNTAFSVNNGVLFNKIGSVLVYYPAGLSGTYTFPQNVSLVADYAFACTRLNSVDLSNVEVIGQAAFMQSSLENVVIPDCVTDVGESAFSFSIYLSSAQLGKGLTAIPSQMFASTSLTSIEIPAGVRTIGNGAFQKNGSLSEIIFAPESELVYIGDQAFFDSGIERISIPASVVAIGNGAFGAVFYPILSEVNFEENSTLHTIGKEAFKNQTSLRNIVLPRNVERLDDYAFINTGIKTIHIPATVTDLGVGVFASCHSLSNITVDGANSHYVDVDGVVYDHAQKILLAYPAGNERTSFDIPTGVTEVGHSAFYGSCNLVRINLASTVTVIQEYGFYECRAVTGYGLSNTLIAIRDYAFSRNEQLTSMNIPTSVLELGKYIFAEDWNIRFINFSIYSQIARIPYGAFAYCGLTGIRIPSNVSTMAQGVFRGCRDLNYITFLSGSKLESISAYMFDGCSNLKSISFESGSALTSIQAHGFEGLRSLNSADFSKTNLQTIDNYAFRFCEHLSKYVIPEGVTYLGRYAFYGCTRLSEVTVPSSMDYIGSFAFFGTEKVDVYFTADTLPANLAEDWDHGVEDYYLGVTTTVIEGDWKYAKLTSGEVSIIKYTGAATELDLTTLNLGGDIISIGGGAFMSSAVEQIVLPRSLRTIQAKAFYRSPLKSVSIPENVIFIGREAFAETPIETLTFAPNAKIRTIEQSAFLKTEKLGCVAIPATVTTMGRAVFKYSGITSLTFVEGSSMTEIPEEAFSHTHISAVVLPDSVTLIDHNAFRQIEELRSVTFGSGEDLMIMSNVFYRTGLETVYIPENVAFVGECAFVALPNLTEFTVSENNPYYKAEDGLLVSKDGRKLITVPAGRNGSLTVPESIEVIGLGSFEGSQLSEVLFLDNANIISLGCRAFYDADGIKEIRIPDSVVTIDYYAFAMCDSLQTVTFAKGSNIKAIYEGVFYGCENLSNVELPDCIVEISEFTFYGCQSLKDIPVGENGVLKGIGDYAFAYAGLTGDYVIPETVIDIGPYAFMGNKFTSVTVPDTNAWSLVIGIGAFEACNKMEEITVPFIGASFEDYEISWFGYIFGAGSYRANNTYLPQSLKKVNISEGITFVGEYAFADLTGLEEINIPYSVQTVYGYAFTNTTATYELTNEITFVPHEEDDAYIGVDGSGISGQLTLAMGTTSVDIGMFNKCENLTGITLPDGVMSIGRSAFENCYGLASINIPDSVTSIGDNAFNACISLTSVSLPEGLTSIGKSVFESCSDLSSVHIPDSVTSIGQNAFAYCRHLTSITIPAGVTSIGASAFNKCTTLYSVTNLSDLVLRMGNTGNGYVAYYAKVIIDKDGNKTFAGASSTKSFTLTEDGFLFECKSGKNRLIAYLGEEETVTLPRDINGEKYEIYKVTGVRNVIIPEGMTAIDNYAFVSCTSLTSITIPDSVTKIGNYAFSDCQNLKSVILGNNITSLGQGAFLRCNSLTEITIPDSVTHLDYGVFSECESLASVTIGNGVTSIGDDVFYMCSSLTSVSIGNSVTSIGIGTFQGCCSLTSIELPDSLTSIDDNAFKSCSSLTSVVLPDDMTSLGNNVFSYCSSLTSVVLPDGMTSLGNEVFSYCSSLTSVVLPDGMTSLGNRVFSYCSALRTLNIPDSLTSMKPNVFNGCSKLEVTVSEGHQFYKVHDDVLYSRDMTQMIYVPETVTNLCIPKSVTEFSLKDNTAIQCVSFEDGSTLPYIRREAFAGCSALTSITLPDSVTSIGISAFAGCSALTDITLPDSVTSIDISAFAGCSALTDITLPDSVNSIGAYAFSECIGLKRFTVPPNVKVLDNFVFEMCSGLTEIVIPDGVETIGTNAFQFCIHLTSITIPDSVSSVGYSAFQGCSDLESVTLSRNMTEISQGMFSGCDSLKSISIPDSVISIHDSAFSNSGLLSITIPDSVISIGKHAFTSCKDLVSVTLGEGVTSIGEKAFYSCSSLYRIEDHSGLLLSFGSTDHGYLAYNAKLLVDKDGNETLIDQLTDRTYLYTEDGFLFECMNGEYTLIAYLGMDEIITLPKDINGESYRIYKFRGGKHVILPDSMTSIHDEAFYRCSSLTSITLPDGLTSIGKMAFSGCTHLTGITLPDSLTSIGEWAFHDCQRITSITIPDGVTILNTYTFKGCLSLTDIHIPSTVEKIYSNVFYETAYYNDPDNWEDGVLYIGDHLIRVSENKKYLTVREGTITIAQGAYKDCHLLKKGAIWGDTFYMFMSATNMETLVLSGQLPHILERYFGYSADPIPITMKNFVLTKDVQVHSEAFRNISGYTIFVEASEKDVRWDEMYPGWNNGNKVVYGDEWITVEFYDQYGEILSSEIYRTSQVIRHPYLELSEGTMESQVLIGWDIDGDGVCDVIPATSTEDIVARPIIETKRNEYTVKFLDADGVTLLFDTILPYGATIIPPVVPEKTGYTVNGWLGYTKDMTVSGHHTFVLDRVHDGGGHDYGMPTWVNPTCTKEGYNKHVCKICGEWFATDHTEPVGHDYSVTEKLATCTEEGELIHTCKYCGDTYSEVIPPKGHEYNRSLLHKATCKEQGEMLYSCHVCGYSVTEKTPLAAHNYQKKTATIQWMRKLIKQIPNAFFGYEGNKTYYYECAACKCIQTEEESNAGSGSAGVHSVSCAHRLGEWSEYLIPICGEGRIEARVCSVCDKAIEFRRTDDSLDHEYVAVVVDPTCIEKGYTIHMCIRCGDTYTDCETDARGHMSDVEAGCLNDQICTACGEIMKKALGHNIIFHDFEYPTCTEVGCMPYESCTRCDYTTRVDIPARGHNYKGEVREPACERSGYTVYRCHCGHMYIDDFVDALGHSFSNWTQTEAPTCTATGTDHRTCERCNRYETRKTPAIGHSYNAVVTAPTCTEKGYTTYICIHCEDRRTDSATDALGHDYTVTVQAPTCTEKGYDEHICTRCEDRWTDSATDALGHDYTVTVQAPTCTEKGYTTHTCHCGNTYADSYVNALGHSYGNWTQTVAPTCTEVGTERRDCEHCDHFETREISADGHDISDWIVDTEPAPGVEGSRHKECIACGETLETDMIEALPVETEGSTETETKQMTEVPTETEKITEEVASSTPNGDDSESLEGCSGVVLSNAFGVILLAVLSLVFAVKRREGEDR